MSDNKEYFNTAYNYRSHNELVYRNIIKYITKKCDINYNTVLDIGCGYGYFINTISSANKYALDLNPDVKKFLKDDVIFESTDILNINTVFSDVKFDMIFMSNVLEHLERNDNMNVLHKIYDKLNNNGKLVIIQPNYYYCYRNYFDDFTHKSVYDHQSMRQLLEASNFRIVYEESKFLPYSSRNVKNIAMMNFMMQIYLLLPSRVRVKSGQMLFVVGKNGSN